MAMGSLILYTYLDFLFLASLPKACLQLDSLSYAPSTTIIINTIFLFYILFMIVLFLASVLQLDSLSVALPTTIIYCTHHLLLVEADKLKENAIYCALITIANETSIKKSVPLSI